MNDLKTLYSNYGKTSDSEIQELLTKIKPVVKSHKGSDTDFGYYYCDDATFKSIVENPRGFSHTFEAEPGERAADLNEYKSIKIVVKTSSPFFLKPDIGEVFDQMTSLDKEETKAVYTALDTALLIEGTDRQEYTLEVKLLK